MRPRNKQVIQTRTPTQRRSQPGTHLSLKIPKATATQNKKKTIEALTNYKVRIDWTFLLYETFQS